MLSVRSHMALQLAGAHYAHEGRRVTRMYAELGMSETRFWSAVDALLDDPEAEREYPAIVRCLRARREVRRWARSA